MINYWIKRVDQLKKENSQLKEIMWLNNINCIHFDGKECRHYLNNKTGHDCDFCDNYEVENAY